MFAIVVVPFRTSNAATWLARCVDGKSRCAMTYFSDSESDARICGCSSIGKLEMMRSIAFGALVELSVPRTMWPVSAAVSASETLSLSRSSPITMTSGIFAQRRAQRARERLRVRADFALIDQAVLERMDELDRIFHRQDVIAARLVEEIHERGERRRFAGARRAADDDESLVIVGDLREMRGQCRAR